MPRTATVRTVTPVIVRTLGRDDFLAAVAGCEASGTTAAAIVDGHLATDASAS
jgi:CRP-like cAMP-binding protein